MPSLTRLSRSWRSLPGRHESRPYGTKELMDTRQCNSSDNHKTIDRSSNLITENRRNFKHPNINNGQLLHWLSGKESTAAVYIHWPYCRRKCTYCNFNKYVSDSVDSDRMVSCLLREWEAVRSGAGVEQPSSLFFGGGTPSLMKPRDVETIIRSNMEKFTPNGPGLKTLFVYLRLKGWKVRFRK